MCEFLQKLIVRSRFNEVMKEKGIQSQKELADLVGSTEVTISRFKTNTRYDITTLFIIKLEEEQYNKISPARLSRLIYLVQSLSLHSSFGSASTVYDNISLLPGSYRPSNSFFR